MVGTRKAAGPNTDTQKKRKGWNGKSINEAEKRALFKKFVEPHLAVIKSLVVKYTDKYQDVEDNNIYVLSQLYMYIHTYDTTKDLKTWIHIVTKRACFNQNKKRSQYLSIQTDIEMCSNDALHQHGTANMAEADFGSLADNLSDKVYGAMMKIDPYKLSPFLLYAQGLKIREIAKIEWKAGHVDKKSEDLVKSRIYWAKKQLQYYLKEYGVTEASYTSAFRNQQSDSGIDW